MLVVFVKLAADSKRAMGMLARQLADFLRGRPPKALPRVTELQRSKPEALVGTALGGQSFAGAPCGEQPATTLEKSPEVTAHRKISGQQLVNEITGSRLSQLDRLILQNVAGKLGLPPYYPGQPDELTLAILEAAREAAGEAGLTGASASALSNVMELYLRSASAPHRGLATPVKVTDEILALFERHQNIAQPLFLATRYLLARQYDKLTLADAALELGNGSGDTANSILGDRKLCIGSTPIIDENMGARANFGNHRHYMAIDASQIPFCSETFDTVTMNYTFYHLEQPERTCAEVFRVLRPGGTFAFNFALRGKVRETRVLPALAAALGMEDHASRADNFVFVDYGAEADTPTLDAAVTMVAKAGFETIKVVHYLSAPLSRLIWLVRDLEIMVGLSAISSVSNPSIASRYRTFCTEVLAPLIANDEALSAAHGGTFSFVTASKPGKRQPSLSDVEVLARRCCPVSHEVLKDCGGWLEGKGVAYPVLRDIPLTIPVYAEIWRAQNPGVDVSERQEFQYLSD